MNEVINRPVISNEQRFQGIPLSGGIAYGKVYFATVTDRSELGDRNIEKDQVLNECKRYEQACKSVISTMFALYQRISSKVGAAEAEIINAQMMIIQDPQLHRDVCDTIKDRLITTEKAVSVVINRYAARFHAIEDVFFKERANDIEDIRQRLLNALGFLDSNLDCITENKCKTSSQDRIIATKELVPSMTFKISPNTTYGFITQHGGINSHAAILARALNIPAVSGIADLMSCMICGQEVIVNGDTGEIIVCPSLKTKKELIKSTPIIEQITTEKPLENFRVMATISNSEEALLAVEAGAEGIGLFRTEYEFLKAECALSEEEQLKRYLDTLMCFKTEPVYFRMLDIGGDKNALWAKIPTEPNPYLGLRGSRLLLKRPDLFVPQARALARASEITGITVHVMYPMVINVTQYEKLKELFIESTADITSSIKHGLMFETPSACLQADELMILADFATVGTNDLTQYLLAVDRNNELVADDYDSTDPIMWKLIKRIAYAADLNKKPLSICGDLASDSNYFQKIIDSGIRSISVYPRKVNSLRKELKSFNL